MYLMTGELREGLKKGVFSISVLTENAKFEVVLNCIWNLWENLLSRVELTVNNYLKISSYFTH